MARPNTKLITHQRKAARARWAADAAAWSQADWSLADAILARRFRVHPRTVARRRAQHERTK